MRYLKDYKLFESDSSSLLDIPEEVDIHLIEIIKKNIKPDAKILEISCGNAVDSKHLKDLGYDVTCTELNDDYIENAKSLGLSCIKHDTRNKFPFNDKQFDLIYARLSLHYFNKEELDTIFKELKRISHKILFTVKVEEDSFKTGKVIIPPYHWIGIVGNNYGSEDSFQIRTGNLYGKKSKWVEILATAEVDSIWKDIILNINDIFLDLEDNDIDVSKSIHYLEEWCKYTIEDSKIIIHGKNINEHNVDGVEFSVKLTASNIEEAKYVFKKAYNYFKSLDIKRINFDINKEIGFANKKISIKELEDWTEKDILEYKYLQINIYEKY